MWVCSVTKTDSKPRSSAIRARVAGSIDSSVGKYATPKSTGAILSGSWLCLFGQRLRPDADGPLRVALRLDPERPVETGPHVLDRRCVGELDQLGLVEPPAQRLEQLIRNVDRRPADAFGVLEDKLLLLAEGGRVAEARQLAHLLLGDAAGMT